MSSKLSVTERGAGPYLWRFGPLDRVLHGMVIVSFYGLLLTGTPLLFSYTRWADVVIRMMGGAHVAGIIHRICAVITFVYFFTHLGRVAYDWYRSENRSEYSWGPHSMLPVMKDLRDLTAMFRWFFGRGAQPEFDRFSYMEKFEYWGVFWGTCIMGASGLLLWFPEMFSLFFPGWIFNVATILHGREALLALGVIFTIHFFNVHLRPGKFPIDLVVFTGRATTDYFKEEHPLEYRRMVENGTLESRIAPPPSKAAYIWALMFGFTSLAVGVILMGLVVWAVFH